MKATEVAKIDSDKPKKFDDDTCEKPSEFNLPNENVNQNKLKVVETIKNNRKYKQFELKLIKHVHL